MEKARILIVEDETIIAMEVESQLQRLGYEVTSVVDTGEKAISKAESDKPDLILMDIRIKGEMDGIDTAEEIRNKFGIPVIFSTAYLDEERIERAKITMPFGYVLKPIQEREFKVTLEMALYVAKVHSERKKTNEELTNNQELLKATLESTADGILVVNIKGKVLHHNARFAEMWRIPESILSSEDDNTLLELILSQLKDPNSFLTKVKHLYQISDEDFDTLEFIDGRCFERFSRPLIQNSVVAGRVWSFRDITERKQAKKALRERESLLTAFTNALPDISFIFDEDGKYIEILASQKHLLIAQPNRMLGKSIYDTLPEGVASEIHSVIRDTIRTNVPQIYEYKLVVQAGETWFQGRTSPMKEQIDGKNTIVWLTHDITKRKQVEEKLQKNEERFKFLAENMADIVWTLDNNFKTIYVSPSIKKVLGFTPEERKLQTLEEVMTPESTQKAMVLFQQVLQRDVEQGTDPDRSVNIEVEYYHAKGHTIWMENILKAIRDEDGAIIGVYGCSRDISERKQISNENDRINKELKEYSTGLEQEVSKRTKELQLSLESAEELKKIAELANKSKSIFLSNISHELRTPMQGIIGFSKFGVSKGEKLEIKKAIEYFNNIHISAKRLMNLLNDILDLSKLESEKADYHFEVEGLSLVIMNIISEFSAVVAEKDISINFKELEFDDGTLMDSDKIMQVVRNLISNAIKFSEPGSNLKLQIDEKASNLHFSIADNGIGIPENELESVFDKFVQSSKTRTKTGGTGLGLAICKEIILGHEGEIWAEVNPNGGSIFRFQIPIHTK
ncbi:MAG: PAS domain S-box protein [Deltaproteobacteria bacterium]|mgnify:CR=1 FL=1|jgi:PAS domain S-box-containing protein|nr:PAS domain S-box protein [Deltaproteobacteria bacterium]MBT3747367.1 PAS domain S-box protein [Bacteroidota bacterium]MBT4090865.1 PAS domain S-box protein [Deltaproteobacteria bacterium]MBT4268491.1 PAS domain S-box protein [Deltaproteobacteria bacterium]MBT7466161.1 PAS domain S-box protein [Bacteroidota bacterium]